MTEIDITHYLILAGVLFSAGLVLIIIKRNIIFSLMGIELMLNGANINLATFSALHANSDGQILAIFIIVLAAAEVAIALAIIINLVKKFRSSDLDKASELEY